MTEAEWLASGDPFRMLRHMEAAASDRKMRLFACACVRRVWHRNRDDRLERILLGVEDFADSLITTRELKPLNQLAWAIEEDEQVVLAPSQLIASELANASAVKQPAPFIGSGPHHIFHGRASAAAAAWRDCELEEFQRAKAVERGQQTILMRDIFGNPFRPVTADPAWLTSDVVALARSIYAERAFDRLPILADALQDAGCDNDDVLGHCRSDGPHVRGCWVVDLVLGKM